MTTDPQTIHTDLRQLPALNALRAFEAAARHESFSRAADELFVTHGAVSHQIRALEAELGVPLFARDGKRVRLTDRGRQYAVEVRASLLSLAESTRRIRSGDRDRRLIVSMLSSFSARWLTPRVGKFIEKHPEVDLELHSTNALIDFNRDDVDLAIRFGYGKYAGLHTEELLDEVFFPACSPRFNGGNLPRTPADLANLPLLRSNDELWRPWFDAAGLTETPEPKRGVLYEDSSNLLQAAIDCQGVALVRRSLAMQEIIAGRLVRLFNVDGPSPWTYFFVCPPAAMQTARVQAFRNWIFDEAEQFRQLYERTPAVCDAPESTLKALP
ncbi:transcriptional regulator GcvA [Caballeronia sp. LP006]|uniref:transcriptional regulator GcvA n=1 Tax=unclassified Caballeronia TaxID=2646786 RepID=UPI00202949FD|nr:MULTISPECIES: transcriptional regulator GcvA [unclassified Caballeronia]MDR5770359.1 transcriptional regulator GcvA [Caballeronia sp. LZ002]MDR5803241.1 transcriptional regulator GcvA [Caballeronia sp. LZ001]MDR5830089.1 transcriptional regulator GcvA [Caballeronia sp. LP006]MDR5845796.1 transcriptional regulator GcvA [Caballeronia sp. LZ003]